jgi:Kef-type K+ transport system membrane component KefB
VARLPGEGLLLTCALALCFALSLLAALAGLAPIVGAFAAGLVLDPSHYAALRARDPQRRGLEELTDSLAAFLVPVFFVLMGMRVDLHALASPGVPAFAAVLTLVAIAGKQVCSLGVLERGVDRLAVGLGMIPRGEVGLIFASIGATLMVGGQAVIPPPLYSAVVVMVGLTTLLTPPLLVWRLRRGAPRRSSAVTS